MVGTHHEAHCAECGFRVRWTEPWQEGITDLDAIAYRRLCKHTDKIATEFPLFRCPNLIEVAGNEKP